MTYFFVGGSQRSGSSLLAASLCAGEETNPYLGESRGFRLLMQTYADMVQRFDEETTFHLGSRQAFDDYYRSVVTSYLGHTLGRHYPATSLVLKEPHLTMSFPDIHRLIPDSKFVMIKRDPRDIVVSMLKVGKRFEEKGQKHLFNSGKIGQIAKSIIPFYRPVINTSAINKAFKRACIWVEYEQMVADPETVIDQIRDFTGLKIELYDPADPMKRTLEEKAASRAKSKGPAIWNTDLMRNKVVSNESVGKYAEFLSEEQIQTVEAATGRLITALGYELVAS